MDLAETGTWAEQLAAWHEVEIRPVPEGRRGMTPGRSMLYPSALMVNEAIRELPEGESITVKELKARLAAAHDTYYVCPVTMTRALRTVVEATHEAVGEGRGLGEVTPVWRAMEPSAAAWRNLSFDPGYLKALRETGD